MCVLWKKRSFLFSKALCDSLGLPVALGLSGWGPHLLALYSEPQGFYSEPQASIPSPKLSILNPKFSILSPKLSILNPLALYSET